MRLRRRTEGGREGGKERGRKDSGKLLLIGQRAPFSAFPGKRADCRARRTDGRTDRGGEGNIWRLGYNLGIISHCALYGAGAGEAGLKLADAGGSMDAWFFVFVDLDMAK